MAVLFVSFVSGRLSVEVVLTCDESDADSFLRCCQMPGASFPVKRRRMLVLPWAVLSVSPKWVKDVMMVSMVMCSALITVVLDGDCNGYSARLVGVGGVVLEEVSAKWKWKTWSRIEVEVLHGLFNLFVRMENGNVE
eukprot:6490927-Amphidinium_carterae.1